MNSCNETIEIWLDELRKNGTDITEEIEEVKGAISNERLWQKGAATQEEVDMHEQNIADLVEYLSILEEMAEESA